MLNWAPGIIIIAESSQCLKTKAWELQTLAHEMHHVDLLIEVTYIDERCFQGRTEGVNSKYGFHILFTYVILEKKIKTQALLKACI